MSIAGLHFTALPARHGIPACGYLVQKDGTALAFSGDTSDCAAFWEAVDGNAATAAVIAECSYPSSMAAMADLSMHMHAGTLAERLRALPSSCTAVVIHRKPGLEDTIANELSAALAGRELRLPQPGDVLQFG